MATLRREIKVFIVRSLAVFNSPQETADAVNQEFKGLGVTRQQCAKYDPTKRNGINLSKELVAEFWATRKDFLEKPENHVPIANLTVRMNLRQQVIDHHKRNPRLVLDTLEQAAKDVGGVFTNRKEITGKDGDPIQTTTVNLSIDDVLAERQKLLDDY